MSYTLYRVQPKDSVFIDRPDFVDSFFELVPAQINGVTNVCWTGWRLVLKSIEPKHTGLYDQSGNPILEYAVLIPNFDWANSSHHLYVWARHTGWTSASSEKNQVTGVSQMIFSPSMIVWWPFNTFPGPNSKSVPNYINYFSPGNSWPNDIVFSGPGEYTAPYNVIYSWESLPPGGWVTSSFKDFTVKIYQIFTSMESPLHGEITVTEERPIEITDTESVTTIVLEIEPKHRLVKWADEFGDEYEFPEGVTVSEDGLEISYPWNLLEEDITITAITEPISYQLTVQVLNDTGGEIIVTPSPNEGLAYLEDTEVQIEAVAENNYVFAKWILVVSGVTTEIVPGDAGFNNPLELTMDADKTVTAVFHVKTYQITPVLDTPSLPHGDIARNLYDPVEGVQSYPEGGVLPGMIVRLSASVVGVGNHFVGWFVDGTLISDEVEYYVTVTQSVTYIAKFGGTVNISKASAIGDASVNLSNATAGAGVAGGESVDSQHLFTYGSAVRLVAESGEDAFFVGWYDYYSQGGQSVQRTDLSEESVITPVDSFGLVAVFASSAMPFYIRLTNSGAVGYGTLSLSGASGVNPLSLLEYESALNLRYDASASLGAVESDKYYRVPGTGKFVVNVSMFSSAATFKKWQIAQIVAREGGGYDIGVAIDLSENMNYELNVASDLVIFALYNSSDPTKIIVGYEDGSLASMGALSLSPAGSNFLHGPPITADYRMGQELRISAEAVNGFRFDGWYSSSGALLYDKPEYLYTVEGGGMLKTFLARFVQDDNAVYEWEGEQFSKQLDWQSKKYKSSVPFNPVCARCYSDDYDGVRMMVKMEDGPDDGGIQRVVELEVKSQDSYRLPIMRPEKYVTLGVKSSTPVTEIATSTSMEGINE